MKPSTLAFCLVIYGCGVWASGCGDEDTPDVLPGDNGSGGASGTTGVGGVGGTGGSATTGGAAGSGGADTGGTGGGAGFAGHAAGAGGSAGSPPNYTPLLTWDFEAGSLGAPVTEVNGNPGDRFTYSDVTARRGSQCGRVERDMAQPPPACGGSRLYGFLDRLPVGIGQGDTIWIRVYFFFPSQMSWGFVYSTADTTEISQCGFNGPDGWGWTKFLALSPDTGHLRPYLQIPSGRRSVTRPTHAGGALHLTNGETGGENLRVGDEVADAIPLDEWVAIQWMLHVHDTAGYSRAWINEKFLGETAVGSTIENASITHNEWRLGNYWNGFPYTDGAPDRGAFYADEVIIATDQAGYGAPTTLDSGGRPYIAPNTNVSDF